MSLTAKWFGFGRNEDYDTGLRHYDRGQLVEAIASFHEALRATTDPALIRLTRFYLMDSYRRLALRKLEQAAYDDAVMAADAAIAIQPNYPDLFVLAARGLLHLDRTDDAERSIQHALKLNGKFREAEYLAGVIAYVRGSHEEGLSLMKAAGERDHRLSATYARVAAVHEETGQVLDIGLFLDYVARIVDEANAHANYADVLVRERRFEEAIDSFKAAIELKPEYADIRCRHGQALLELDRVEEALGEFDAAIAVNGNYVEAWAQRGIALKRLGRKEEAREAFRKVRELDPSHAVARFELGG
jgi:tetratricopeptide (TPR) repeat protein